MLSDGMNFVRNTDGKFELNAESIQQQLLFNIFLNYSKIKDDDPLTTVTAINSLEVELLLLFREVSYKDPAILKDILLEIDLLMIKTAAFTHEDINFYSSNDTGIKLSKHPTKCFLISQHVTSSLIKSFLNAFFPTNKTLEEAKNLESSQSPTLADLSSKANALLELVRIDRLFSSLAPATPAAARGGGASSAPRPSAVAAAPAPAADRAGGGDSSAPRPSAVAAAPAPAADRAGGRASSAPQQNTFNNYDINSINQTFALQSSTPVIPAIRTGGGVSSAPHRPSAAAAPVAVAPAAARTGGGAAAAPAAAFAAVRTGGGTAAAPAPVVAAAAAAPAAPEEPRNIVEERRRRRRGRGGRGGRGDDQHPTQLDSDSAPQRTAAAAAPAATSITADPDPVAVDAPAPAAPAAARRVVGAAASATDRILTNDNPDDPALPGSPGSPGSPSSPVNPTHTSRLRQSSRGRGDRNR